MVDRLLSQETPKTSLTHELEVSPDERNVAMARETVNAELERMRNTLLDMRAATARQKNLNMSVKNGLCELETSLDVIDSMRKFWWVSLRRIERQNTSSKETQAPSPSMATPVGGKRSASSPAAEREEKRPKEAEDGFVTIQSKAAKRKAKAVAKAKARPEVVNEPQRPTQGEGLSSRTPKAKAKTKRRAGPRRPKGQVVLINPGQGGTYAEILGAMRKDVAPEDSGAEIRAIRKTTAGEVLLELRKCDDRARFQEAIQKAVGDKGTVRSVSPSLRLEILDLDALTTKTDVEDALRRDYPTLRGELKVTLFSPNQREQRKALVQMGEEEASPILQKGKMKVGWVVCRVRRRVEVDRCFRCLGYGHTRRGCTGPDRSGDCWRCGGKDHKASTCNATPLCALCSVVPEAKSDHVQGSGACGVFKEALQAKKARSLAR